jgi:hypothetical protein
MNTDNCRKETGRDNTGIHQKLLIFQQNGSAESKIKGIIKYGEGCFTTQVISIDTPLPLIIDDATIYLPEDFSADLVLDFLKHPDLSHDLARMCHKRNIPIVASGKKLPDTGAITPPTWCGLSRQVCLGTYGDKFGSPEFEVEISDGKLVRVNVLRGAPCGATWEAAERMKGLSVDEAPVRMGLEPQFFCTANPAGWDPIYGKSPVHFAGNIHSKALAAAIRKAEE